MHPLDVADLHALQAAVVRFPCQNRAGVNGQFHLLRAWAMKRISRAKAAVASNEGQAGVFDPGRAMRAVRRRACLPVSDLSRRSAWWSSLQPVIPHPGKNSSWRNQNRSRSNRPTQENTTSRHAGAVTWPLLRSNLPARVAGERQC